MFIGIWALIWNRPGISPGAAPAYCTVAGWPPMFTETAASGLGTTLMAGRPSTPGGSVRPSPVAQRVTTDPRCVGSGPAAGPWPEESAVKRPGAVGLTAI